MNIIIESDSATIEVGKDTKLGKELIQDLCLEGEGWSDFAVDFVETLGKGTDKQWFFEFVDIVGNNVVLTFSTC